MKYGINKLLILVTLIALPVFSKAQYLQGLYDIDSSNDWGIDIFVQSDSSYLIFGTKAYPVPQWDFFNLQISADGSNVLSKKVQQYDNLNLFMGYSGATVKLQDGGFISPITAQLYYGLGLQRSWAGIIKYNAEGDTVFLKTYTDTALYYDRMFCASLIPSGGYIAGGQHGLYADSYPPGFLIRTDTNGNEIWTQNYQLDPYQYVVINNIISLADGRIAGHY